MVCNESYPLRIIKCPIQLTVFLNSKSELGTHFSVFRNDLDLYAVLLWLVFHLFYTIQKQKEYFLLVGFYCTKQMTNFLNLTMDK